MNFKKIIRNALMLWFFLHLFAVRPGFGKWDMESYNKHIDGEMTRLTEGKIRIFAKGSYGFDLHCPPAPPKKDAMYAVENRGFVSTVFIE